MKTFHLIKVDGGWRIRRDDGWKGFWVGKKLYKTMMEAKKAVLWFELRREQTARRR